MGKISLRDFFKLPELLLLLITPLLPLGGFTLTLIISWVVHVWLRKSNKGHTTSGRRAQVIVTIICLAVMALLGGIMRGIDASTAAEIQRNTQDISFTGIAKDIGSFLQGTAAVVPFLLPMMLMMGVFVLTQVAFWMVGVKRLWDRWEVRVAK